MNLLRLLVLVPLVGLSWETGCARLPGLPTAVDPVCGRRVTQVDAPAVREYRGETFYFDSEACAFGFDDCPEDYRRRAEADRAEATWEDDEPGARSAEGGARQ